MNRLGEALDRTEGRMLDVDEELIINAARSWHTLTNPTDELIERLAWRVVGERSLVDVVNNDPGPSARRLVRSVLDVLTVTADKETPHD